MVKCPDCHKERNATEKTCPFCGSAKKPKVPVTGCLMFVVIGVILGIWLLNEERPYYVNRDKANYRAAPHGDILGYMKKGTPVKCVSVNDGWCETRKDNRAIYFPVKSLTKEKTPELPQTSVPKK